MSGDYSRKRFNPENHYQGVLRQQGRVDLDADWNEYIDLQDRRWRAETIDVIGRCGVPSETPDGFKIAVTDGELTVGQGRIYVDGHLAENHGAAAQFNPILEESYGTAPLPVKDQPYGGPVSVPPQVRSLLYLDVWRREVTHLQEPQLIEPAVNVDTTTRYQAAWQVKVLGNIAADVTCPTPLTDIGTWPSENLPSAARLTTTTVAVSTEPDDPCLVPPSGGYRGLENHLYRVEVHSATNAAVRVKWSRENAHVATNVLEILSTGKTIRVESLGHDDVLRFKNGDWVEITSDSREFSGQSGVMRKVTVDDSNQTLSFEALDPSEFPDGPVDAADHLRVIRWDQRGSIRRPDGTELMNLDLGTEGLIELTATDPSCVLECGIQVTLSIDGSGTAHSGDYWCFAARTADADIERLDKAPPLGVHHHFCTLAIIEPDGTIDDCRPVFPPLTELTPGCCTVVVLPGDNIQAAIDSLPDGGCVCLKMGVHEIAEPLRIDKSNVSLHGETLGARVVRNNAAALLVIGHPDGLLLENITVSGIHFEFENKGVQQAGLPALVAIDRCRHTKIEGCVVEAQELRSLVGIMIGRSIGIEIADNQINRATFGIWVIRDTLLLSVRRNALTAITANNSDGGIVGIFPMDAFGPSEVWDNNITGFFFGIVLNKGLDFTDTPFSLASGSVIAGNRILRLNAQTGFSEATAFGISVAANECAIRNNFLVYAAVDYGGIEVSGANARVEGNSVRSLAREASATPSIGILFARRGSQGSNLGSNGGGIFGNSIFGAQDGVLLIGNIGAEVLDNRIESGEASEARFGIGLLVSSRVRVHGNRITNAAFPLTANGGMANEFADNTLLHGGGGATLLNQMSVEFTRNRVEDMRKYGLIARQGLAKFALIENRFLSCGYQQAPAIGIGVSQHFGELHIESCEVMNTGVSPGNATISPLAWGIVATDVLEGRVQSNSVTYANPLLMDANQEHRALWLRGSLETTSATGQVVLGFSVQILDNKFLGPGRSALVEIAQLVVNRTFIRRFERVFFNNNFCWHVSVRAQPAATVSLVGRSAIVMGNHIKAYVALPSVDFNGIEEAVYMGNIAQTDPVHFGGVPTPIPRFNKP